MRWRKRKAVLGGEGLDGEADVTDTGTAQAGSGAAAVSGHRGSAPGVGLAVSRTGPATATGPGATAVSGSMTVVQQRRGPQEPAAWPHQIGVIPPSADSFQHRAETEKLQAATDGGGIAVLHQVPAGGGVPGQVLTGMGGVGKTQLAVDYARAAWVDGTLDVLVWITASTRLAVVTGYAQAGIELCRADPGNPEQAARSFLAWLTPKAAAQLCRWLIVLDDVADPDDLRGLWPPASEHGRTLVTTRRRDAALTGDGRTLVEVGLFTKEEALAYLTAFLAAHGRTEPEAQLAALAADLGYLPLALAQAAAYLVDSGDDVAAYRALLTDRTTTLADAAPDALPDEQTLPLAAAWSLSIGRADTLRPVGLARPLLHLAALLDANGIPQDVLTSTPALTHLTAHRTRTGQDPTEEPDPVSPRDAVRALRALYRLSLIDHAPGTPHQAVRVHQLIQRATRDTLTPTQHDQYARTAADALLAAWPEIERDTAFAQTLRANTAALTACAEDALYRPDAHAVLYRTGNSLGETGQFTAAVAHYRQLADLALLRLGPDHLCTLTARHSLALWQGSAEDAAGAASALAELLEDYLRVLGPDHPHTLAVRHELARWRGAAGDTAGATNAFTDLLNDRTRVLGPDHLDTLTTRGHLARWHGKAGDSASAASALAELLADYLRVLGPDHSHTLAVRHELAQWRGVAGDAAGATSAFTDLLNDRTRVLGPDHPHTLAARRSLASWRRRAGDAAGAASALAELLEDYLRVLGPDHPHTLAVRHELARWREKFWPGTTARPPSSDRS
ncbi:tetratricopeptide repeat protein [Streptomyces sp. NBC_00576]|uniref:tetratricopeptide repeat protein n=1 Tax=Streptomyces sp. NBC_00576 TaxID=2903665 RepID=UPI002E82244A|nr:tetratricopeptide repeat protein [Streptomyces sp. NBC_00576]WUB70041.1 tetratricopeptide repeat protein [Streptomyces sp. NBC_00576]